MMKKLGILIISFALSGCFSNRSTASSFTYFSRVRQTEFEKHRAAMEASAFTKAEIDSVGLFFESEQPPFEYEKVGLIEVKAARYTSDSDLLDELKTLALQRGCNAILHISKSHAVRDDSPAFSRDQSLYSAGTFNGIAVRILKK
jgi:hypothetical protein